MVKVTVVTPSFNQGQFIEETILSVLNQTYKNFEYIIVDGGSTDNTMEVVNKYKDKIDIIIHEKDTGQSDAINKGFKLATGELVGWINSDDILYPDCVGNIVELYGKYPGGSIYYNCNGRMIDAKGNTIKEYPIIIPDRDYLIKKDYRVLQQGSFYKREMLEQVNYLDESIQYCMDLDLWLKLLAIAPVYYTNLPSTIAFRIWEESKTSTGNQFFFRNIKEVLFKYGANRFSKTILKLNWYIFKAEIKYLMK